MNKHSFESRAKMKKAEIFRKIEAEDPDNKRDLGKRIHLIDELLKAERRVNKLQNPKIFVSFAGAYGQELTKSVIRTISQLQAPDTGEKFDTLNGMMSHGRPNVIKHITSLIEPCCIFFGILTREFELTLNSPDGQWAPGGWVLLEAGIALNMGLPVILFVERGVHKNFWFDMLGSVRHAEFERANPKPGLKAAEGLVKQWYLELRAQPAQ